MGGEGDLAGEAISTKRNAARFVEVASELSRAGAQARHDIAMTCHVLESIGEESLGDRRLP